MGRGLKNEGLMCLKNLEQEAEEVEEMVGTIQSAKQRRSLNLKKSTPFGPFSTAI
jgi:hypothetical protein